jgi:phospholipase/carboxylesterase
MEAQSVEGRSLPYILVKPEGFSPNAGYPLVILMHGFGANMRDLAGLSPAIDPDGYVYAFPNAPYRVDLGMGATGSSWALGRPGVEAPPLEGPSVEEMLDGFIVEVSEQVDVEPGQIVLGGFSQGGGLTLRYGLPRAEQFAGFSVLSGFFRDEDEVKGRIDSQPRRPVFVGHGRHDQVVPLERGQATKAFLESHGYTTTYNEYDMQHSISDTEIRDLTAWLHDTLPPKKT